MGENSSGGFIVDVWEGNGGFSFDVWEDNGGFSRLFTVGWLARQMSAVLKVEMSPFVWGLAGRAVFITVKNKVFSI